jgi:branched-chain amino acid aminotransferase
MNAETKTNFIVEKIKESKLPKADFSNLVFGKLFTDHMMVADYTDGKWQTPKIMPYQALPYEPSAKVFHYGQAIFEGMKAYKDKEGNAFLFRPEDNFERMNQSAKRLGMPPIPKDYFMDGLKELVELDKDWIPTGDGESLYLRPVYIATENAVAASPSDSYRFMIIASPAGKYYSGDVKVKIEDKFSRACDGGVGYAKAAGNYAAQFYPTEIAKSEGFQQIIWTDSAEHKYLEEAGTMNMFFRIGDKLLTAPTVPESTRILPGVTRRSIIQLAKDNNIDVEVRPVEVAEVIEASKNGQLKEIFGAGTAATILPIAGLKYKDYYTDLPKPEKSFADFFKTKLMDIQYNRSEDPYGWRIPVK